jgi:hypothetical protein
LNLNPGDIEMPVRNMIENLVIDPNNFNPDQIKLDLLKEFDADETSWKAALTLRDNNITELNGKLTAAQAAAWEMLQQQPAKQDPETSGQQPKPEDDETIVTDADMFTTVERG